MRGKSVLVVRLSALGDVAMTVPVIYSVAREYPNLQLNILTKPFFARLFINKPGNVNILTVDDCNGFSGTLRSLRILCGKHFDMVADLHNVLRSWIIDLFCLLRGNSVFIVDKMRVGRLLLLSHKIGGQPSYIDRYADVFARMGYPVDMSFYSVFDGNDIVSYGELGNNAIGIAPFARYKNKIYPLDKMQKIVESLTKEGFFVYLFGAKGQEANLLDSWQELYPNCMSLAGKLEINEELGIICQLKLMVTMDSANQHLASLVGTKAFTIWGGTTPACGFLGYNQREADTTCRNIDCQPCTVSGSDSCHYGDFHCMAQIPPEYIYNKILECLQNDKRQG